MILSGEQTSSSLKKSGPTVVLNPQSSSAILLSTCKVLKSTCIDDKIFVPGSKIYARGFKNRDTAWVEYLLCFEVILPVVYRFLCTTSTSYLVVFGVAILRIGEVILSERALRSG